MHSTIYSNKKRSFWFHYNKPESRKLAKPQITIHFCGVCHIVDNIICNTPTQGRIRKTQPYWVMAGKTSTLTIDCGVAIIN